MKMVLVPFYRGAVVFKLGQILVVQFHYVLVPFYRGAVVFIYKRNKIKLNFVLVPFYRGAVVFPESEISESKRIMFSSPFIEERLYLKRLKA